MVNPRDCLNSIVVRNSGTVFDLSRSVQTRIPMKKSIIIAALLMATSVGFAQQRHQKDPQEKVLIQTERMRAVLDLDEQQYASIRQINEKYAGKRSELKAETAQDKNRRMEERKAIQAEREKEINSVLRPEQRTKWEKVKAERTAKREAGMEGRKAKKFVRVAETLELTPDQQSRLKAENQAFREKREALKKNGKSDTDDAAIAKLKQDHKAAVKEILTPGQFEQWKKMKSDRKGRHKNSRK